MHWTIELLWIVGSDYPKVWQRIARIFVQWNMFNALAIIVLDEKDHCLIDISADDISSISIARGPNNNNLSLYWIGLIRELY